MGELEPEKLPEKGRMRKGLRLSVGMKLGGMISILLVGSVLGLVSLATHLFVDYNTAQIQQITFDTAASLSVQMRQTFESTTEKMRILGSLMMEDDSSAQASVKTLVSEDTQLLALFVHRKAPAVQLPVQPVVQASAAVPAAGATTDSAPAPAADAMASANSDAAASPAPAVAPGGLVLRAQALSGALSGYNAKDLAGQGLVLEDVLKRGESGIQIFVTQVMSDIPVLVLSIPFVKEGNHFTHTLTGLIRLDSIQKNFTELANVTGFIVDSKGTLLSHTDPARTLAHENLAGLPIVQDFISGKRSIQREYDNPMTSTAYMGAFKTVGFAGLGVFAELPKARAFEGAHRVRYQSLLAAAIVLFISFMLGNYFSARTITGPILVLADAAKRISKGDFKLALVPRAKDEIGDLSLTFNQMAQGLEERDKVKEVFNKFHNEAIAQKLLSGEVKLGGDRLNATVFFSDVRGFTSLSESMQPEQVVEMLNEYMTCMVGIIHAHKGVVDKYVGDAIMALWGVPIASPDDTENAVRACIEMRRELERLNTRRLSRGQPALKIGMGLNCGEVIAGNIGSNEKMEYTVIGDVVNVASRVESMTKEYGTDLLISEAVREKVAQKFVFEVVQSAKVKGKKEALALYKVEGFIGADGAPVIVETPYSRYASEKSDKAVHEDKPGGDVVSLETASTAEEIVPGEESEIDLSGFIIKKSA